MRDVTGRYWVCQSLWDSFLYLGKLSLVSISAAILFLRSWHVYFPLEFEFRGKSCVEREHGEENGISCLLRCILLLYIEWIWTNCCKLSRDFVGAIRTATINCRVSFIDLYLVFPRNFRIVFLLHTNTVILLELYCGTITEPELPVIFPTQFQTWSKIWYPISDLKPWSPARDRSAWQAVSMCNQMVTSEIRE